MYVLIEIRGSEKEHFLQGQLTQDVTRLEQAVSLPAAWCNPKGRVITQVRLLRLENAIGLVVPEPLADFVVQKLTMYRLRADVRIDRPNQQWTWLAVGDANGFAELESHEILPEANAACESGGLIAVDYSTADRFVEVYGYSSAFSNARLAADVGMSGEQYAAMKIRAGVADITPDNSEKYTPHMLNLDRLGAISFSKGCYTGQEVVARTQNLGQSKRRLMRYRCDAADIVVGDKVSDGERDVGTVVNVQGSDVLAVTPVALHDRDLVIKGATATPVGVGPLQGTD